MEIAIASHVRWVDRGDSVVLLSLANGDFFGLRDEAAAVWRRLSEAGADSHTAVSSGDAALRSFLNRGWLVPSTEVSTETRALAQSTWRTWKGLPIGRALCTQAFVRLHLRTSGFGGAYKRVMRAARRFRPADLERSADATTALRSFLRAEALTPTHEGHEDCLPRSLSLFLFMRMSGIAVRHHIGVSRMGFASHAWVTLEGRSLLESDERTAAFVTIALSDDVANDY